MKNWGGYAANQILHVGNLLFSITIGYLIVSKIPVQEKTKKLILILIVNLSFKKIQQKRQ